MRCDAAIGNSLRAVRTQTARLGALFTDTGPDAVVQELMANEAALAGVQGLHIFPFGGVTKTAKVAGNGTARPPLDPPPRCVQRMKFDGSMSCGPAK